MTKFSPGAKNASKLKLDPLFATRPPGRPRTGERASLSAIAISNWVCGAPPCLGKKLNFTSKCDKRHFNPDWILYKGTSKCAVSCMLGGRSLPVLVRACSRSGCALFSSNWYCLAHGGHAAQGGGGGGAYHAAAAVVSLAISPQAGQVSRPGGAHCWPKSQVDRRRERGREMPTSDADR